MSVYLIKPFKMTVRWYIILHSMKRRDNCSYSYQVYQGPLPSRIASQIFIQGSCRMNILRGRRWKKTLNAPVTNVLMCNTSYLYFLIQHYVLWKHLLGDIFELFRTKKKLDSLDWSTTGFYCLDLTCLGCYAHRCSWLA